MRLTASDNNGNTAGCTRATPVVDVVPPVAVCVSVTVDANDSPTLDEFDLDGGSSDNCPSLSLDSISATFGCNDLGPNTVARGVVDAFGLTAMCDASVFVEDNTPPQASCHSTLDVILDGGGDATITVDDIDTGATDDFCSLASRTLDTTMVDCSHTSGSVTVVMEAADGSGNMASCETTVTVIDNTNPIASCRTDC